jgi:quinol monooxygenase YgiN
VKPANLVVELDVKPDQAETFIAMFRREFVARSRTEPGCLLYDLWVDPQRPARMVIVESWASQADLDRHLAMPWFAEWGPRLEAAQATPLVVRAFTVA